MIKNTRRKGLVKKLSRRKINHKSLKNRKTNRKKMKGGKLSRKRMTGGKNCTDADLTKYRDKAQHSTIKLKAKYDDAVNKFEEALKAANRNELRTSFGQSGPLVSRRILNNLVTRVLHASYRLEKAKDKNYVQEVTDNTDPYKRGADGHLTSESKLRLKRSSGWGTRGNTFYRINLHNVFDSSGNPGRYSSELMRFSEIEYFAKILTQNLGGEVSNAVIRSFWTILHRAQRRCENNSSEIHLNYKLRKHKLLEQVKKSEGEGASPSTVLSKNDASAVAVDLNNVGVELPFFSGEELSSRHNDEGGCFIVWGVIKDFSNAMRNLQKAESTLKASMFQKRRCSHRIRDINEFFHAVKKYRDVFISEKFDKMTSAYMRGLIKLKEHENALFRSSFRKDFFMKVYLKCIEYIFGKEINKENFFIPQRSNWIYR